jgi:hypothetical protein
MIKVIRCKEDEEEKFGSKEEKEIMLDSMEEKEE